MKEVQTKKWYVLKECLNVKNNQIDLFAENL